MTRIYQPVPLQEGVTVVLSQEASHHLAGVLRAVTGDKLVLFNGEGGEFEAVITHISRKRVEVRVESFSSREAESPIHLKLAQGIARGEKMDWIVQKAVELGVSRFIPLWTGRTNVKLSAEREEKRLQHWQGVAISACEQCGRNRIPTIATPITFQQWLPAVTAPHRFVLSPYVQSGLPEAIPAGSTVLLLVGPEGGLEEEEVAAAMGQGFKPLNLGPRILRTETAALAALTAIQVKFGDMWLSA